MLQGYSHFAVDRSADYDNLLRVLKGEAKISKPSTEFRERHSVNEHIPEEHEPYFAKVINAQVQNKLAEVRFKRVGQTDIIAAEPARALFEVLLVREEGVSAERLSELSSLHPTLTDAMVKELSQVGLLEEDPPSSGCFAVPHRYKPVLEWAIYEWLHDPRSVVSNR